MFKYLLIIIAVILAVTLTQQTVQADAKDFKIFEVKKSLPLTDKEKPYYDYYVSIGKEQDVESGKILDVYRRVPVVDAYRNQSHPDMRVLVGRLKIIYSQDSMSVGRLHKISSRGQTPVLDYEKMMVGDRVELSKIADTNDNEKPLKRKRRIASAKLKTETMPQLVPPAEVTPIVPRPVQPAEPVEVNPNKG